MKNYLWSLDLILRILEDAQNFDTRIWIAAVGIGEFFQSKKAQSFKELI